MITTIIHDSWNHPWEGFRTCFYQCTQQEIDWVSPIYNDCKLEIGWPPTGSISWHLNHVGACKQSYTADIANPHQSKNDTHWSVKQDLNELITALDNTTSEFIDVCKNANPNTLILGKDGQFLAQYLGIALRHEIWHAGQIALIRRLYTNRVK